MSLEDLIERLQELDLLLDTDPKFPSVTGFVADTGGRSWWAHPEAKQMYGLSCGLRDHPDVLMVKLVSGKLTFVHRPLWAAIVAIGTAREPWQMDGLSKEAKALLKKADGGGKIESSGDPVRELENRLLAHAVSVHTEHGHHMKEVQSWAAWAKSVKLGKVKLTPDEARAQIESVVVRLNKQFGARGTLPWQTEKTLARVPTRHARVRTPRKA
jgi:hypothetical protein